MREGLRELLGPRPIVLAPMAGGPTSCALVAAVSAAGGLGLLPAGYRSAAQLRQDLAELRARRVERFGVNLFIPSRPCADRAALERYLARLAPEGARHGVRLAAARWDDDEFQGKLAVLLADPPPLVTFAFGCPDPDVVAALHHAGSRVVVTITHPDEVPTATRAGVDGLCAQGIEAGGHRGGALDAPERDLPLFALLEAVRASTDLPLLAAGGVVDAATVVAALRAGAVACQVGTAFLLADEAGTSAAHREALGAGRFTRTMVTRAFTGRSARGLANYLAQLGRDAPACYPELHHATLPLRRAAAAAGDLERVHLWAGTGFSAVEARPAGEIVDRLTSSRP